MREKFTYIKLNFDFFVVSYEGKHFATLKPIDENSVKGIIKMLNNAYELGVNNTIKWEIQ